MGPFTEMIPEQLEKCKGSKWERGDARAPGVDGCVASAQEHVIGRKQTILYHLVRQPTFK